MLRFDKSTEDVQAIGNRNQPEPHGSLQRARVESGATGPGPAPGCAPTPGALTAPRARGARSDPQPQREQQRSVAHSRPPPPSFYGERLKAPKAREPPPREDRGRPPPHLPQGRRPPPRSAPGPDAACSRPPRCRERPGRATGQRVPRERPPAPPPPAPRSRAPAALPAPRRRPGAGGPGGAVKLRRPPRAVPRPLPPREPSPPEPARPASRLSPHPAPGAAAARPTSPGERLSPRAAPRPPPAHSLLRRQQRRQPGPPIPATAPAPPSPPPAAAAPRATARAPERTASRGTAALRSGARRLRVRGEAAGEEAEARASGSAFRACARSRSRGREGAAQARWASRLPDLGSPRLASPAPPGEEMAAGAVSPGSGGGRRPARGKGALSGAASDRGDPAPSRSSVSAIGAGKRAELAGRPSASPCSRLAPVCEAVSSVSRRKRLRQRWKSQLLWKSFLVCSENTLYQRRSVRLQLETAGLSDNKS
ncbi:basic proline-rich protein-like isoform X1 [Gallus gallus]|uniref:basic proline-rich protein-like isoform X1 n=1 Tax=Gallus gallus TaxID=9031 RepID=UPI001EFF8C43|nr:basic proline-rich protein-like isoform X1 [Gallus gallus]